MSSLTNYGAAAIAAGTGLPQTLFVRFHTGDPGADATDNEAIEDTREQIDLEEGDTPADAVNDAAANWTGLAANETASHFSLWDASTAGNPWVVGPLEPSVSLVASGEATVGAGNIRLHAITYGE